MFYPRAQFFHQIDIPSTVSKLPETTVVRLDPFVRMYACRRVWIKVDPFHTRVKHACLSLFSYVDDS